ncbi:MAG: hypothetical protein AAFZ80_11950 [Cyanobacteria bacterium P01_A01_bin.105]
MTRPIQLGRMLLLGLAISGWGEVAQAGKTAPLETGPNSYRLAHRVSCCSRAVPLKIAQAAPRFSLQYPQDSQVTVRGEDDVEIVSGPSMGELDNDPRLDIHTQAQLLRENPADVVSQYIEQLLAEDALVLLYRTVTVDGRSSFRLWLGERPDPRTGELRNSLVTFVGYGTTQTAQIISHYIDETAEAAVVDLHDSFTHLAPPTAE